jgi:hypothetical protein
MIPKNLLLCGIVAMLWYVVINIIVPLQDPGYDVASQTISELSAIDAGTRQLWFVLCIFYSLLFMAFGSGVWITARENQKLKIAGAVILFDALFGLFWPPMHQREVIAAGGGSLTDTLHLVWAFVHLALMLLMIGFGAAAFGKNFRIFSVAVVVLFMIFGFLTSRDSSGIETGVPTPYIGIWERINIGAYMLWVVVFTLALLKRENLADRKKMHLATSLIS